MDKKKSVKKVNFTLEQDVNFTLEQDVSFTLEQDVNDHRLSRVLAMLFP